eukprot:jgi/Hompol1/3326/HPOL_006473-RA
MSQDPQTNTISYGSGSSCFASTNTSTAVDSLHIAAIFIIIACSLLGVTLPILSQAYFKHGIHSLWLTNCIKLFAVGVILSTALIHKFVPSHELLQSPCLPGVVSNNFDMLSGAIALFGMLLTHTLHLLAANAMHALIQDVDTPTPPTSDSDPTSDMEAADADKLEAPAQAIMKTHSMPTMVSLPLIKTDTQQSYQSHHSIRSSVSNLHAHRPGLLIFHQSQQQNHRVLHVYIIEVCIALHSLIFGFSLGASTSRFKILLVALSFHQFIEGEALSNVFIEGQFQRQGFAFVTIAAYSFVTPIGIAIGLATYGWMSQNTWQSVLVEGTVNAISAGMLLYSALVNIMAPHFQSPEFKEASTWTQAWQVTCVWLGVYSMALAGLWLD